MISFVATPIGNLKDITLRALEALRAADVIFCEDTRHTLKLLNAYEIKKPLLSCHRFNESEAAEKIIACSREGKEVCIVSDAGMPVISDPGNAVCRKLREAGEAYTVLPGACASRVNARENGDPFLPSCPSPGTVLRLMACFCFPASCRPVPGTVFMQGANQKTHNAVLCPAVTEATS